MLPPPCDKFIFIVMLMGISFFAANSQNGFEQNDAQRTFRPISGSGKPFINPGIDIGGTPFFNDAWKYGTVKLADNSIHNNVQLRINLLSQEVHFLNQDKLEMTGLPGVIKEVIFSDTVKNQKIQYDFRCGYSPVDNQDEKNFYLVLCEGKLNLLGSLRKKVRERKEDMSGEVRKELITYDDYYFFSNNTLTPIKLNKMYLLENMPGRENKIEDFVKSNKLSYKSAEDLKKIVCYYNSLW